MVYLISSFCSPPKQLKHLLNIIVFCERKEHKLKGIKIEEELARKMVNKC